MVQESPQPPSWARAASDENKNLGELLSFASANYGRHVDWFLKHHDTGIKNLAAVVVAETTLVGVAVSPNGKAAFLFFTALLVMLACAAPILCWLAIVSSRQSYRASLESVYLTAMVIWGMGLASEVAVGKHAILAARCPSCTDRTLYPKRWVDDTFGAESCDDFVEKKLGHRKNTLFLYTVTLIVIGIGACGLGVLGACLVWHNR